MIEIMISAMIIMAKLSICGVAIFAFYTIFKWAWNDFMSIDWDDPDRY